MSRHGIALFFAMMMMGVAATPVQAVTITYAFSLTADTDNLDDASNVPVVFGVTEFSGPFTGSMTVDYPGLPSSSPTLTDFSLTIGTQTWDLSDNPQYGLTADATGALTYLFLRVDHDGNPLIQFDSNGNLIDPIGRIFEVGVNFGSPAFTVWRAYDGNCRVGVGYVRLDCIQGTAQSTSITVVDEAAPVPEPATLMLTSLGLAAVAARRRRSTGRL